MAGGVAMSGLRPLDGRCAWLPLVGGAAAFLSQEVAVVRELRLERKLFAWVAAGVVYPLAPDCERAQGLQLARVAPPAVLEAGQGVGIAGVQADDGAPCQAAPFAAAAVGLKPRGTLVLFGRVGVFARRVFEYLPLAIRVVAFGVGDDLADHLRCDFRWRLAGTHGQPVELLCHGGRQRHLDAPARLPGGVVTAVCMGGSDLGYVVTDREHRKTAKQFWPRLGTVSVPCIWSVRVVVVAGEWAGWRALAVRGSGSAVWRLAEGVAGGRIGWRFCARRGRVRWTVEGKSLAALGCSRS